MLGGSDLIAFVSVTDPARARAFYEGTLGLTVIDESPYALVFDAHGTMLRVTFVTELSPAPFTVLGWRVSDARATVRDLASRGVGTVRYQGMTQDGDGIWTTPNGDRVAWFRDPDGNTLSVTEVTTA